MSPGRTHGKNAPARTGLLALVVLGLASLASDAPAPAPAAPAVASTDRAPVLPPEPGAAPALEVRVLDDAGAPVASATVRAEREDDPGVASTVTTDATGVARFAVLAPGRWVLRADAEGAAPAGGVWRIPVAEPVALTVHAAGRVSGIVLGVDGLPADGAEVGIVGSGIWPERVEIAGVDGRFTIAAVPPGVYEVTARDGGARAEPRHGLSVEAGARVVLSFSLREGAALVGVVVDGASGEPIEGARVRVGSAALSLDARTATTDATGGFTLAGFTPGAALHVEASADGFVSSIASSCTAGSACRVRLDPAGAVSGVVVDQDARPVANASIEIVGEGTYGTPVRLHPGDAELARAGGVPGRLPVTAEVPPIPIVPGEHARTVAAVAPAPTAVRTNARGEFHVEGVPPGDLEVVARADGFAAGRSERLVLAPGERRSGVEIVLGPGGRVDGHVVDENGEGVAGAVLEHRSAGDPSPRVLVTGEGGAFVVEGVVGSVTLRAMAGGRPPCERRVEVAPHETTSATLRFDPAGLRVAGRVLDARGRPIDGAQIRVESMRPGGGLARTVTSELDGTFVAERVPAPPLRVVADHCDYAISGGRDVTSLEDEVELVLERPMTVRGSVRDGWTDEGLDGAEVRLVSFAVPPVVRSVETDDEGGYVVPRLGPGRWTLEIARDGYVRRAEDVTVRANRWEDAELDEVVLEPSASIEGDVVDRLGRVTLGVLVSLGADPDVRTRSDERGHFVLGGVGPGEHVLRFEHPAGGGLELDVEVVRGREPAAVVAHLPGRADGDAILAPSSRRGVALELAGAGGEIRVEAVLGRLGASGVRPGDVLLGVDGEAVGDLAAGERRLLGSGPAVLELLRDGERFYVRVDRRSWTPR